jgi:hypothetical protein
VEAVPLPTLTAPRVLRHCLDIRRSWPQSVGTLRHEQGPQGRGETGDPPSPRETASAKGGVRLLEPRGTMVHGPWMCKSAASLAFHTGFPGCQAREPACWSRRLARHSEACWSDWPACRAFGGLLRHAGRQALKAGPGRLSRPRRACRGMPAGLPQHARPGRLVMLDSTPGSSITHGLPKCPLTWAGHPGQAGRQASGRAGRQGAHSVRLGRLCRLGELPSHTVCYL